MTLDVAIRGHIRRVLMKHSGKVAPTCRELQIARSTFYAYARGWAWLDSNGHPDPNRVADARKCREYWQPAELRDTPSKREGKRKRMDQVNRERMPVDMGRMRCGDSNQRGGW